MMLWRLCWHRATSSARRRTNSDLQRFPGEMGVVTPFRAQANLIEELIAHDDALAAVLASRNFISETAHQFRSAALSRRDGRGDAVQGAGKPDRGTYRPR